MVSSKCDIALSNSFCAILSAQLILLFVVSSAQCCKKKTVRSSTGASTKDQLPAGQNAPGQPATGASPGQAAAKAVQQTAAGAGAVAPGTAAAAGTAGAPASPAGPNALGGADSKAQLGKSGEDKRKEDATQIEDFEDSEKKKNDVVPLDKVAKMGNIDNIYKEKKAQVEKEIEDMKSTHEMENKDTLIIAQPNMHVKVDETRCKLYETNDEPTLDDEVEDPLI